MLDRILHVPTSYFDTVPLGRIVNRFSSDQNTIDVMLPRTLGTKYVQIYINFLQEWRWIQFWLQLQLSLLLPLLRPSS